ncbi:MAG: 23S rRNA (pseudouridine(1915)-N(3))-methyltransferase RlmH [Deltaproteobacteria bacterium]|nr:23S rRNA (pseudouridine(1915)-N(3))-methyltransferase RlmH [Deltaproteobacteria bacterium]
MEVRVLWVGKTQEDYLREGLNIFKSRLKRYLDFKTVVIKGEKIPPGARTEPLLKREEQRILEALEPADKVVVLDPKGKAMGSMEFSKFLGGLQDQGIRSLVFVLGSSMGLGPAVTDRAEFRISLSPMTFTHEMARLILLEQIFRAMTILKGEKYHK